MDITRARQIMQSTESIQVLHNGAPVWIEKVMDNNTAEVTRPGKSSREVVPVYMLIENNPAK